jgi:hypothetical protein
MADATALPNIEPGQTWRLHTGDEVKVDRVNGDHVSGASRQAARSATGELRGTVGIAAFEGHRRQFKGAVLIAPVYRITFLAPVEGDHPSEDPAFQALSAAPGVQIENRRTPHIASATPQDEIRADLAEYVAEVAAPNANAARRLVEDAVALHVAISDFQATEIR